MLEIPAIDSSITASIATVKRYAPPNQRYLWPCFHKFVFLNLDMFYWIDFFFFFVISFFVAGIARLVGENPEEVTD